jgi:hypothetical protein
MDKSKEIQLTDCISKSAELIESYVLEETGKINYKGISDEEEYYQLEGDRAGLIKYGLQILKAAVSKGNADEDQGPSELVLKLSPIFQSGTEVQVVKIKVLEEIESNENTKKYPSKIVHKVFGLGIITAILVILGFAMVGAIQVIRWIF